MALDSGKNGTRREFLSGWVLLAGALLTAVPGAALAQDGAGNPPPPMQPSRPPMERAFHGYGGPGREGMGRWWDNPQVAADLNLSADQKQKMDDIFQQNRMKLIDLHASLQKEEATLEPLISADVPDETKILAQIDKIAQARAELEKSNARMLLAVRQVLTADQWTKLKAARTQRMARGPGRGGPDGAAGGAPGMAAGPN
ncbi:MAG TPA: Spy/CpxP family protein refolding chaperone [Silvibacterium sp.]|nr:Spy/CpxP family protein refolding chaperone [Silvibacterium sp.]